MNEELRKKIVVESKKYSINGTPYRSSLTCLEAAFKAGSSFGIREGFEMAIKSLNSNEAHEFQRSYGEFINVARWKCWLDKEGQRLGIIPKDGEE